MKNLILIALLFINISVATPPKDITGKWKVTHADANLTGMNVPEKQRAAVLNMLRKSFANGVFNFRANHQFYLTANIPNFPENLVWEYRADTGYLLITEAKGGSKIMMADVKEKNGQVYFMIKESSVVLKMQKL
jgi:hypothetical protein